MLDVRGQQNGGRGAARYITSQSLGSDKKSLNLRAVIITDSMIISVHVELIIVDNTAKGTYDERESAPRGQKIVPRSVEHNLYG